MRLGDMLHILRFECTLSIRDRDNIGICTCETSSKGVDPYINYEVVEWFPGGSSTATDITVLIDLEEKNG